jgi:hypothetical protein
MSFCSLYRRLNQFHLPCWREQPLGTTCRGGWLPPGLQVTNLPLVMLREYRYEETMESRLLPHEHILLRDPPPTIGETHELK